MLRYLAHSIVDLPAHLGMDHHGLQVLELLEVSLSLLDFLRIIELPCDLLRPDPFLSHLIGLVVFDDVDFQIMMLSELLLADWANNLLILMNMLDSLPLCDAVNPLVMLVEVVPRRELLLAFMTGPTVIRFLRINVRINLVYQ